MGTSDVQGGERRLAPRIRAGEQPSFIDPGAPLGGLAQTYLAAIRAGDRREAIGLVLAAATAGTPPGALYARVLQPCQYELGRLWQAREISVAMEHYGSAVTQMVMSRLQPFVPAQARVGRWIVATAALGNLHEIGARFVADFFEMAGWDTLYLGASAPTADVVAEVARRPADVVAISASLDEHVAGVAELVAALRAEPACAAVRILAGGPPFGAGDDLWKHVGADGSASDGAGAVALAERLLAAAA